jgi:hypothetical protein
MSEKKSPVHVIITSTYIILAVVTLIPMASASKECLLGYKALCSFSPISTILLLAGATLHFYLNRRTVNTKTA